MLMATGIAVASGVAGATASQAAVTCSGWSWSNPDAGSGRSLGTYNLKVGPYSACGNVTQISSGTLLYYHCYVYNDYGNSWTHLRISGTDTQGWYSDDNLPLNSDGISRGAINPC
ncbi:hypothetical protein [Kineosporia succinea]|uniref:SH3 domain-containing protein n=1 Tax=Kineosporia succinea TaxID=84632 RepID=A0ABT9PBN9_9ACTN|nr:hypothetical protein [Kineosporia succinea]MDP9830123.1 hypothetical protein [Kineosporia succinea]